MEPFSRAAALANQTLSPLYATAPAFTPQELDFIAEWSAAMHRVGVSTQFDLGYLFLTEALHIFPTGADDPIWLVHKTPKGAVAVRLWPGVAEIIPTIEQALSRVACSLTDALLPGGSG